MYENTKEAVKELGIDAEIEKIEDLIEIVKLGVLSAPSLMVDGEILVSGQTTSVKRIKKLLQKYCMYTGIRIGRTHRRSRRDGRKKNCGYF